jgi:hypothetical protein
MAKLEKKYLHVGPVGPTTGLHNPPHSSIDLPVASVIFLSTAHTNPVAPPVSPARRLPSPPSRPAMAFNKIKVANPIVEMDGK